jgi:hypothetical protein
MLPLVLTFSDMPLERALSMKSMSQGIRNGSPPIMSMSLMPLSVRISRRAVASLKVMSAGRPPSGLKQKEHCWLHLVVG